MTKQRIEYRALSLASSAVFLASFAVLFYAVSYRTTNSLYSVLAEHWIPLLFVPVALPILSVFRLAYLRFVKLVRIPIVDGWSIHVIILAPYAIVLAATYPLWKLGGSG
ncbi:MAG: hypothetical protein QNI98_11765 [Woeseiaceae bacterium]|nr:hypothetical protein [Woeseiaceae bacterium]